MKGRKAILYDNGEVQIVVNGKHIIVWVCANGRKGARLDGKTGFETGATVSEAVENLLKNVSGQVR